MWSALLALSTALAGPCDGPGLERELDRASTLRVPAAYEALAACDPTRAARAAPRALERMYGEDTERGAVVAMVEVGAAPAVRAWLDGGRVPPDDRLSMLRAIGEGCEAAPSREAFFVDLRAGLGDRFFVERWHRGLDGCRGEAGRAILEQALAGDGFGVGARDRGAFLDVLEVYARNRRDGAFPLIERLFAQLTDPEEQAYVLQMIPRAAGYDTPQGVDPVQAAQAAELVLRLGEGLDADRVDVARAVLLRLGQQEAADRMVRFRWPDAWRVGGGQYRYAAIASAVWTCKPGKVRARVITGELVEAGTRWPEAVAAAAEASLPTGWALLDAPPCDVAPEVVVRVSEVPLKTAAERAEWASAARGPWTERVKGRKVELIEGGPIAQ